MKILTFIISVDGDECEAPGDRREDALEEVGLVFFIMIQMAAYLNGNATRIRD